MIKRLLFSILTACVLYTSSAQSITSNSPLCVDSRPTLQLKASGGTTYQWSGPNNFFSNDQNPSVINATYLNAGTYTCVIDGKSTLITTVKIGKNDGQFYVGNYVSGGNLNIYASSNFGYSSNNYSFLWSGPNGFYSTQAYNILSEVNKKMEGTYLVNVKDEYGCVSVSSGTVKFNNPDCPYVPAIFIQTNNNSFGWTGTNNTVVIDACEGTNLTFKTDTTGWGKSSIQWYRDDKIITNANNLILESKAEGTYYANITKGTCSYITYKIQVKFTNSFVPILANINDQKTEKLICKNGGFAMLNFGGYDRGFLANSEKKQWYKDGIAQDGATNNSFNVTEEGVYQLKVKFGQCEGVSKSLTVKKSDKIETKFSFDNNNFDIKTLKLCNDNQRNIYVNTLGDGVQQINKNGQLYINVQTNVYGTSQNITKQPGTYVLQTTQGTCTAYDTLKLEYGNVISLPTLSNNYFSSCNNPSVLYHYVSYLAGTQSGFMKWERDGSVYSTGSDYVYPNINGTYQAKYNNPNTGCTGVSDKIVVNLPTTASKQIIRIYNNPKTIKLCKNIKGSAIIQVENSFFNAVWKKDGKVHDASNNNYRTTVSEAGKYWYEYNNGQCVLYSDTVEVTVQEIPKITLTQTCNTSNNTVKLSASKLSGVRYNWFRNGAFTKDIKDTTFTTTQSGTYQVEIAQNGCFASSNEVNLGAIISENTTICNGDSLTLKSTGDLQQSYAWTGPNNFKSVLQNAVLNKTSKKNQGIYSVQATDKNGCSFKTQTNVIINDYPAFVLPKTFTACAGTDFEFSNINPQPLTDSTETVSFFSIINPAKQL